jgi:hypothetical protein
LLDPAQVMSPHAAITGEHDRAQPELAFTVRCSNVNVRRLLPFIGIKVKPE